MANYSYQYETSPRKIEPEYRGKQRKSSNTNNRKTSVVKTQKNVKKKNKNIIQARIFINLMIIFLIIFAVIACQTLVEQKYKEKQNLLDEYNELYSRINSSQEVSEDIRSIATGYGMQVKSATLIKLDKSDYIEPSNEEEENDESWIQKIFKSIIK